MVLVGSLFSGSGQVDLRFDWSVASLKPICRQTVTDLQADREHLVHALVPEHLGGEGQHLLNTRVYLHLRQQTGISSSVGCILTCAVPTTEIGTPCSSYY